MKIGIDARLWNESGVGRYLRNLVTNLAAIDTKNEYVLFFKKNEYQTVVMPGENFRKVLADIHWHSVAEQLLFPAILTKERCDVVHFPYFSVPIFYTRPYVVTIHDLILHHFSTGKATTLPYIFYKAKQLGYRYVINKAAHDAKKIFAVSKTTKQEIIDHLHIPEEKIVVTYEGVEVKKEKISTSAIMSSPYFLYVGNTYPHKNVLVLVDAFAKASKTHIMHLVIVGKRDYFTAELERYVIEKEIKNVHFLGYVSDNELASLYTGATAVVVPSLMEGFGLPAGEALARGCLVLLSNIPVHHEIIGEGGIYFDPQNSDKLAQMLLVVIKEKNNYKSVVTKGVEKIRNYSWEKMTQETKNVYESCTRL